LQESDEEIGEEVGDVALVAANIFVTLGAPKEANIETPILYVSSVQKARERLAARGVNVGPIQKDRQGTHYFEMRDLENNMIEFCEES
jgi:hypothetical protein